MKMLVPVYRSFGLADLYGPEAVPSHAGTRVVAFRVRERRAELGKSTTGGVPWVFSTISAVS
jgi:hypothetical protein